MPTELALIGVLCFLGAGMMLVTVAMGAILLPLHKHPDPVVQSLFADPAGRVLMFVEGFGALILAGLGLAAGTMIFRRAAKAGLVLRTTVAFTAFCVIADMIVQGWLIVPALRRIAPTLKWPQSLMYDPRFRPTGPIAVAVVLLAIICAIALTLRRERVRDALHAVGPAV